MNFADQRKQASKQASRIGATSDGPELPRGYGASPTQYQGENGSKTLDIIDSGTKGTIVNKPNEAYSVIKPISQRETEVVEQKKYRK